MWSLRVLALGGLTSCASIISDTQYSVELSSTPAGVPVTVQDEQGRDIFTNTTPTIVPLRSSDGYFSKANYTIHFGEPDQGRSVRLRPSLDGWYWGNFLFSGPLGFFIVDPLTGAMFDLPDALSIDLTANLIEDAELEELHATLKETAFAEPPTSSMPLEQALELIGHPSTVSIRDGSREVMFWEGLRGGLLSLSTKGERAGAFDYEGPED